MSLCSVTDKVRDRCVFMFSKLAGVALPDAEPGKQMYVISVDAKKGKHIAQLRQSGGKAFVKNT